MAKQASLHKINGKADGRSYYFSQNGGFLSRQINPGMSQRVKTAPEFANTRRNGKEFGSMGMLAGAMVRMLSMRWRFILDPITTGKLGKELYAQLRATAGVWGQRVLPTAQYGDILPLLNKYSKNQLPDGVAEMFNSFTFEQIGSDAGIIVVNNEQGASTATGWGEEIAAKGADGAKFVTIAIDCSTPEFSEDSDGYVMITQPKFQEVSSSDVAIKESDTLIEENLNTGWPSIATGLPRPMAIGLVCLPYKQIGTQKYVLQELCSFACVTPTYRAS